MQQTKTYQLNLMEPGDVFSPDPLNQNMEKVEAALDAARAEAGAANSALNTRLAVLEARKVAVGRYIGTGSAVTIDLGFEPTALILQYGTATVLALGIGSSMTGVTLTSTGFRVTTSAWLTENSRYYYLAIL